MNYTLNGKIYDVIISDGAIELQSLSETIIFENAYTQICNALESEYWQSGLEFTHSLKDFISYYEDEYIRCYLNDHRNEGVVMIHNNN